MIVSSYDSRPFVQLLSAVLPNGGALVVLAHVYFDESGTHDGSPVMTMAGYVMLSEQAQRFSRDWSKYLKKMNIPFAHQTDCALGFGHYEGMSVDLRTTIQKELISHIKRRTIIGVGVSVDPNYFRDQMRGLDAAISPYSFCMLGCLTAVRSWADRTDFQGKIAYFFEAGHEHSDEASALMNYIPVAEDGRASAYRYLSHTFIDKREAPPLQAADMLAWQLCKYHKDKLNGKTSPRQDFKALVRDGDGGFDFTRASVDEFRDALVQSAALRKGGSD